MKRHLFSGILSYLLLGISCTVSAQHATTIFDSTTVMMEESGLSHVENHQRIKINDYQGCKQYANLTLDYDPLSAYVEFREAKIYRKGNATPEIVSLDNIYDYVAPARLIYWGASQKMLLIGHLDPGDEVEFKSYRKGFTYALLADDSKYIPPMRGHFYDIVPFWSDQPILTKYYELNILKNKNLQFQVYNGELKIDSTSMGDRIVYSFTKNNIQPIKKEARMVADNDVQCKLLLSTSPDWETKSRWFYGVNEDYGSFTATPELKALVTDLLKSASTELDSISILTHWVADNMRYAGIPMGEGEGFTLHNVAMNLTDRCGVCKDKASLLIAMLRAAGFESYAAMTMAHERIDRIPADQFNHCVAVVRRHNGELTPLDPTWVPNVRELWSSAEQQQGYLPGTPEGCDLQVTPISPASDHYIKIYSIEKINKKGDLECILTITAEGQSDAAVRRIFSAQKSEWLYNLHRELLKIDPRVQLLEVNHTNPEAYLQQPVAIAYNFVIPNYAIVANKEITFIPFALRNIFASAMPHLFFNTDEETRQYGFADNCSRMIDITQTILLPKGYKKAINLPEDSSIQSAAASYQGSYTLDKNTLLINHRISLNKRVYDAEDWPSFRSVVAAQQNCSKQYITITK